MYSLFSCEDCSNTVVAIQINQKGFLWRIECSCPKSSDESASEANIGSGLCQLFWRIFESLYKFLTISKYNHCNTYVLLATIKPFLYFILGAKTTKHGAISCYLCLHLFYMCISILDPGQDQGRIWYEFHFHDIYHLVNNS